MARKRAFAASEGVEFDKSTQFEMRRERLLKIAAGSFNLNSFSGTSLRDIASKVNITDAALYYYVKNKEELVFLCYDRALRMIADVTERARTTPGTGLNKLRCYIDGHVEAMCGPEGPIAILSEVSSLSPAHATVIRKRVREAADAIVALINIGVEDGSIEACDPVMACRAIVGALNWVPHWYDPGRGHTCEDVKKTFVPLLSQGIARRP